MRIAGPCKCDGRKLLIRAINSGQIADREWVLFSFFGSIFVLFSTLECFWGQIFLVRLIESKTVCGLDIAQH